MNPVSIQENHRQHYEAMLLELARYENIAICEKQAAESCFWIAVQYWEQVLAQVKAVGFSDDAAEIHFYRECKPLFTGLIEYYVRLSEGLSCAPRDPEPALRYWTGERSRLDWYLSKHDTFLHYYLSGETYADPLYFLRMNNHLPGNYLPAYDRDETWRCSHDHVLAGYLAMLRYHVFTCEKLQSLQIAVEKNEKSV